MADPDFIAQQRTFTAWLREPDAHPPPPGVETRRLQVYRELFAGSIEGLLAGGFPQTRRLLGDPAWRALVTRFYASHRCRTPLFPAIGGEFVRWCEHLDNVPPWLHPLLHWERMETELMLDDAALPPHDRDGDLFDGVPVLSPHVRVLAYAWPVHRPEALETAEQAPSQPTLLLLRRLADGTVRSSELSPMMYRLLELLDGGERSGRDTLLALAAEAGLSDPQALLEQGRGMLERLRDESTVLGTAPR